MAPSFSAAAAAAGGPGGPTGLIPVFGGGSAAAAAAAAAADGSFSMGQLAGALPSANDTPSQFLLRQLSDEESGDEAKEAAMARARKSCFVQELVLSTLNSKKAADSIRGSSSFASAGLAEEEDFVSRLSATAVRPAAAPQLSQPRPPAQQQQQAQQQRVETAAAPAVKEEEWEEGGADKASVSSSDSSLFLS